nr:unnamed protein product [Callosobruchus chinensis]
MILRPLRTPPYMCELNPIELAWAKLKFIVRSYNITGDFNITRLKEITVEAMSSISMDYWKKICQHVKDIEDQFWEHDRMMEETEPIIINLNTDDDSETESDDPDEDNDEKTKQNMEKGRQPEPSGGVTVLAGAYGSHFAVRTSAGISVVACREDCKLPLMLRVIIPNTGTDWDVKNYKDLTTILEKIEGISEINMICLQKSNTTNGTEIKIKLEPTYRYGDISKEFHSVTKRGHSLRRYLRDRFIRPLHNNVKEETKDNVLTLLEARFGLDWEELIPLSTWVFYNNVFKDNQDAGMVEQLMQIYNPPIDSNIEILRDVISIFLQQNEIQDTENHESETKKITLEIRSYGTSETYEEEVIPIEIPIVQQGEGQDHNECKLGTSSLGSSSSSR